MIKIWKFISATLVIHAELNFKGYLAHNSLIGVTCDDIKDLNLFFMVHWMIIVISSSFIYLSFGNYLVGNISFRFILKYSHLSSIFLHFIWDNFMSNFTMVSLWMNDIMIWIFPCPSTVLSHLWAVFHYSRTFGIRS